MATTTRTNSTRARKTKVAEAVEAQTTPKVTRIEAIKAKIAAFNLTPGQKAVVGFIAGLVTIGATYYVCMSITLVIATAVATLTGSFFLTWMAVFVGQVLSIFAGLLSGARMQQFIVEDGYKEVLALPGKLFSWMSRAKASVNATAPAGV